MKPYVLKRITPELILDFFEHFLPQYLPKYRSTVKVIKNNLPDEYIVELIPTTCTRIKRFLSSTTSLYNHTIYFNLFNTYPNDTLFFGVASCHYYIACRWLLYLVQKFGFFKVFEEKDNQIFIEHAAFYKDSSSSEAQTYLKRKKVAKSIITNTTIAHKKACHGTDFKLIGVATGYANGEKFSNKSYISDELTNFDEFSANTKDGTYILINSFAKTPKFAARLL